MANIKSRPYPNPKGFLSSDRLVFVVVSATIIGILAETGIIRVSGFVNVRDVYFPNYSF
jgi:hypothetical protein